MKTINKEKLAKVINTRFPRIANYLKKETKTKTISEIHFTLSMTYVLHKIYFDKQDTYILNYLKNNYIKEYLELVEDDISLDYINKIINIILTKYPTEELLYNLEEIELINLLKDYIDISNLYNLKINILKTYKAIKKQYKDITII